MQPPIQRNDLWRILPGLLISLAAIAGLSLLVDWREFAAAVRQADFRYLALAFPVYLFSYFLRARGWQILLLEEPSYKKVFLTMHAGYLLNNIFPLRLGEFGRAYLLGKSGLGFWRVIPTILVERAFDMTLAIGLLLGTLPFAADLPGAWRGSLVGGVLALAGFGCFYLLARQREWVLQKFERLGGRWPKLIAAGRQRLASFLTGLSALTDAARFLRVLGWMTANWGLAVIFQFLVLRAYLPEAKPLWAAFALGVAAMGVAIPSSPGYVGVYEAAFVGALALVGVSTSPALAYALTTHVMYLGITGIFGAYALAQEGESLGRLFQRVKMRQV